MQSGKKTLRNGRFATPATDAQALRLIKAIIVLGTMLILIALGAGGALMLQKKHASQPLSTLTASDVQAMGESVFGLPSIDWEYWARQNPDIVAWVVIPGTSISQPIAYAPQREEGYYLSHDATGMPNIYGCPYITNSCDKGLDSQNTLILGHNMSDGTMFAELLSYQDAGFLAQHRTIYLLTPHGEQRYLISKAYHADSPLLIEPADRKTITLVTCARTDDSPERLLIAACITEQA